MGGKTERAVREMERRETDKACSFLLNGEGSQKQRSGGGEGKTKMKKTRREKEGEERWRREVSGSKMTNSRHSSWFCLLNSAVMEAWIRVQNCEGNIEREEERENRRVVIHFSLSIQAQNHIKEFRRARERGRG